jgi:hypothetical protein
MSDQAQRDALASRMSELLGLPLSNIKLLIPLISDEELQHLASLPDDQFLSESTKVISAAQQKQFQALENNAGAPPAAPAAKPALSLSVNPRGGGVGGDAPAAPPAAAPAPPAAEPAPGGGRKLSLSLKRDDPPASDTPRGMGVELAAMGAPPESGGAPPPPAGGPEPDTEAHDAGEAGEADATSPVQEGAAAAIPQMKSLNRRKKSDEGSKGTKIAMYAGFAAAGIICLGLGVMFIKTLFMSDPNDDIASGPPTPPPVEQPVDPPTDGGETPADGAETPTDGGETPADGGETPADGGETPSDGGTETAGTATPDDGSDIFDEPDDQGTATAATTAVDNGEIRFPPALLAHIKANMPDKVDSITKDWEQRDRDHRIKFLVEIGQWSGPVPESVQALLNKQAGTKQPDDEPVDGPDEVIEEPLEPEAIPKPELVKVIVRAAQANSPLALDAIVKTNADQINFAGPSGETAMHFAARLGKVKNVELLLKYNAKLDVKDNDGNTPLHAACIGQAQADAVAALLIEAGADVDARDNLQNTPLAKAAGYGAISVAKLLIEKGADVNAADLYGATPLHKAKSLDMAKILLKAGANAKAVTKKGESVADKANGNANLVEFLVSQGSEPPK